MLIVTYAEQHLMTPREMACCCSCALVEHNSWNTCGRPNMSVACIASHHGITSRKLSVV